MDELPSSGETYAGRDNGAAWRTEAQNRINDIRKGDFVVRVKAANGLPVVNADIRVEQLQHSFQFGSAVAPRQPNGGRQDLSAKVSELI